MVVSRVRKSAFVRLFDKTPKGVVCPHFFELILSNGCPFDCAYCYLKLTLRGNSKPTLFTNDWLQVQRELESIPGGLFSTGELADSLALPPPLLEPALDYFRSQWTRYLLLLTKSANVGLLMESLPTNQVIVSFSVNSIPAAVKFEKGAPDPLRRLEVAQELKRLGWRVRIRIDPIIIEAGIEPYKVICQKVADVEPELVTVGSLRQYPGLFRFAAQAPRQGLVLAWDRRMRYALEQRVAIYRQIAEWLGFQPGLCKETDEVWEGLGWKFRGCNCTVSNGCNAVASDWGTKELEAGIAGR
ncbi:MAG: hypothetical protein HYU86_10105 [Chloroflexi bacterium]|nr:hypothetical protein [Chloroflexota bacterium]